MNIGLMELSKTCSCYFFHLESEISVFFNQYMNLIIIILIA